MIELPFKGINVLDMGKKFLIFILILSSERESFCLKQGHKITSRFPETVSAADAVQTFSRKLGERRCQSVSREFPQPSLW